MKKTFTLEIVGIFILKIILLAIIWYVCFSKPLDDHDAQKMNQAVYTHFFSVSQQHTNNKVTPSD